VNSAKIYPSRLGIDVYLLYKDFIYFSVKLTNFSLVYFIPALQILVVLIHLT